MIKWRLSQNNHLFWSSAGWSRSFGRSWRTVSISWGALKWVKAVTSNEHHVISSLVCSYKMLCTLTNPFFSFFEFHGPHIGGVPVLSEVKTIRTRSLKCILRYINLTSVPKNVDMGSTYKRIIRFVIADVWQDGSRLINCHQSVRRKNNTNKMLK